MSEAGKPENRGRFGKGVSGNPKGRPKKELPPRSSPFDVIVDRTLSVTRNGVAREITMEEALQHRTFQDALAGKRQAERQVLKWIEKREAWYAKQPARTKSRKVEVKNSPSPDNAKEALEFLGIVSRDTRFDETDPYYPRQLLEPWAVQAALDRRRSLEPLKDGEVRDILRSTSDAERLRWPRGSRE